MSCTKILELICETAIDLFKVDHSSVVIFDESFKFGKVVAEAPKENLLFPERVLKIEGIKAEEELISKKIIINEPDLKINNPIDEIGLMLQKHKIRSILIVPIVIKNVTLASFSLDVFSKSKKFDDYEISLCKTLANYAAISIRNNKLVNDLSLLHEIGSKINRKTNISFTDVRKIILDYAINAIKTKNIFIALYDNVTQNYKLDHIVTESPKTEKVDENKIKFGLTDLIRQRKKPILFKNNDIIKLIDEKKIELVGKQAKVWMGSPIFIGNEFYGVIAIQHFYDENYYDEYDLKLLHSITSQASLAFYNAKLLHEQNKSNAFIQTSNALSSDINLKKISNVLLKNIKKVVPFDRATMQRIDRKNRALIVSINYSPDDILLRPLDQDQLIRKVFANNYPFLISNTLESEDWGAHILTDEVNSWIGIPLFFDNEPIGLITLEHFTKGFYNNRHILDLIPLQHQASRILVFKDAIYKNKKQEIIISSITSKLFSKFKLEELLNSIVEEIFENISCSHCAIFLPYFENEKKILRPVAIHGKNSSKIKTRKFILNSKEEGIAGYVFRNKVSVKEMDAGMHPSFAGFRNPTAPKESIMVVPILFGEKVLGLISVSQIPLINFSEYTLSIIEEIATYAAIALERSFDIDRLKDIVINIFNAITIEDTLENIVSGACQLTQTEYGILFITDNNFNVLMRHPIPTMGFEFPQPQITKDNNLTRILIESQIIRHIQDLSKADILIHQKIQDEFSSLIGIPFKIDENKKGVLYVFDKQRHLISETEKYMLEIISSFASAAIRKSFLRNELKLKNQELSAINKLGQNIIDKSNEYSIAKEIYSSCLNLVDLFEFNDFFICKYNVRTKEAIFLIWIASGVELENSRLKKIKVHDGGLVDMIIKSGKPLLIRDWATEKFEYNITPEVITSEQLSWLGVPLFINDETVGVLSVQSIEKNKFNEETKRLLEIISNQAAVVFRNNINYKEVIRHREFHEKAINSITETIKSSTFDANEMLSHIIKWLYRITEFTTCNINLSDIVIGIYISGAREIEEFYIKDTELKKTFKNITVKEKAFFNNMKNIGSNRLYRVKPTNHKEKTKYFKPLLNDNSLFGYFEFMPFTDCDITEFGAGLVDSIAKLTVVIIQMEELHKDIIVREKIYSKSNTAYDFVHRLSNMVGTIPVWIQFINEKLANESEISNQIKPYIQRIERDTQNLLNSIDELSKKPLPTEINMNSLLDAVINYLILQIFSKDNIILNIDNINPNLYKIKGQYQDIFTALQIIVDNAVEAMQNKTGEISISARNGIYEDGKGLFVIISDQGIGIDKDHQRSIFSPLHSSKGEDRGYGLWRTKMVIERSLNGNIEIDSTIGKGTTVTIFLPRC